MSNLWHVPLWVSYYEPGLIRQYNISVFEIAHGKVNFSSFLRQIAASFATTAVPPPPPPPTKAGSEPPPPRLPLGRAA